MRSGKRNESQPPGRGQSIASVAGRQHGVIARTQLAALGLDRFAVRRRVAAGTLHPLHGGTCMPSGAIPSREQVVISRR